MINEDVQAAALRQASNYNAEVVCITPESPTELLADTLRDCIGFASAWAAHLSDSGKDKAAKEVEAAVARARKAYHFCERDIPLLEEVK